MIEAADISTRLADAWNPAGNPRGSGFTILACLRDRLGLTSIQAGDNRAQAVYSNSACEE